MLICRSLRLRCHRIRPAAVSDRAGRVAPCNCRSAARRSPCGRAAPSRCGSAGRDRPRHRHPVISHEAARPPRAAMRCGAAEQRDEVAAFQLNELHSIPASSPRRRGNGVTPSAATASRHPARRFAKGRPRSSLMMQPAGKVSPLPRCPIKSDQERKCCEKKKIAGCRQHRSKRYANCSGTTPGPL